MIFPSSDDPITKSQLLITFRGTEQHYFLQVALLQLSLKVPLWLDVLCLQHKKSVVFPMDFPSVPILRGSETLRFGLEIFLLRQRH